MYPSATCACPSHRPYDPAHDRILGASLGGVTFAELETGFVVHLHWCLCLESTITHWASFATLVGSGGAGWAGRPVRPRWAGLAACARGALAPHALSPVAPDSPVTPGSPWRLFLRRAGFALSPVAPVVPVAPFSPSHRSCLFACRAGFACRARFPSRPFLAVGAFVTGRARLARRACPACCACFSGRPVSPFSPCSPRSPLSPGAAFRKSIALLRSLLRG